MGFERDVDSDLPILGEVGLPREIKGALLGVDIEAVEPDVGVVEVPGGRKARRGALRPGGDSWDRARDQYEQEHSGWHPPEPDENTATLIEYLVGKAPIPDGTFGRRELQAAWSAVNSMEHRPHGWQGRFQALQRPAVDRGRRNAVLGRGYQ